MPGLWAVWFPLGCSIGWFGAYALVVGLSFFISLVAFAWAVGGVLFVSPFPGVWA